MTIGIDVDEVLREFVKALTKRYKKDFPDHWTKDVTEYDLAPSFQLGSDIWPYTYSKNVIADVFLKAEAVPGARSLMRCLRENGYKIHIITSQPRMYECDPAPLTLSWIENNGIPWDSFTFSHEKWKIDCDLYLDDSLKNLNAYKEHGKIAVAMDRPWNKEWDGIRIKQPWDLLKVIDGLQANKPGRPE
jgi:5'(3')-deoxyribonucleotidase